MLFFNLKFCIIISSNFKLQTFFKVSAFATEQVDNIVRRYGGTNIGKAINHAKNEFLIHRRPDLAHIMIVITDGISNNNETFYSDEAR